jgi:hypothetical protein
LPDIFQPDEPSFCSYPRKYKIAGIYSNECFFVGE